MLWVSSSLLEAYSPASNSCSLTSVDPQVNPVLSIAIHLLFFLRSRFWEPELSKVLRRMLLSSSTTGGWSPHPTPAPFTVCSPQIYSRAEYRNFFSYLYITLWRIYYKSSLGWKRVLWRRASWINCFLNYSLSRSSFLKVFQALIEMDMIEEYIIYP